MYYINLDYSKRQTVCPEDFKAKNYRLRIMVVEYIEVKINFLIFLSVFILSVVEPYAAV